jgi:hypothetical protein
VSATCPMIDYSAMHELAREAWDLYDRAESAAHLVRPSIPILFFGDSEAYNRSERRIVTVGLNPSRLEFPEGEPFARFPTAEHLQGATRSPAFYDKYVEALNEYFCSDPYTAWFDTFEPLLGGFGCSFRPGSRNTALHTDLCSPLATDPTWSRLSNEQRATLEQGGVTLWHRLIVHLQPQVILISVAGRHLLKSRFAPLSDWRTIHKLERHNPYEFRHRLVRLGSGGQSHLIFGQAAQKPFGTISNADKSNIGRLLAERLLDAWPTA